MKSAVASLALGLLFVLSACDVSTAPALPQENIIDTFFNPSDGYDELAPGIFFEEQEGGLHLELSPLQLDDTSLVTLKAAVAKRAGTEFEADWRDFLASAEEAYSQVERVGRSKMLAAMETSYENTLKAQRQGEIHAQALPNCNTGATAAPTTAKPGAKGTASIDCNIINVNITVKANARAGTSSDKDSDTIGSSGYASAVAYGTYSCYSTAESVARLKSTNIVFASKKASNSKCKL